MELPQTFSEAIAQFVASLTGALPGYFLRLLRLPSYGRVQEQRDRLRSALNRSPDFSVVALVRAVCPEAEPNYSEEPDILEEVLARMADDADRHQDVLGEVFNRMDEGGTDR